MYRTFNCGIGMILCVAAESAETVLAELQRQGEAAWAIGHIERAETGERVVIQG